MAKENKPPVTINDVAKLCGVSKSTVSRALFHPEMVSETMRERVKRAVEQLNFVPNPVARALNFGEISVVAIVIPSAQTYLQSDLVLGCRQQLLQHGMSLVILDNILYEQRTNEYQKVLKQLICNGIIFCFENDDRFILEMSSHLPVVSFEYRAKNGEFSSVETDVEEIAALSFAHLHQNGHRRIGWILGRKGDVMTQRYENALKTLYQRHGMAWEEELVARDSWSYEAGYFGAKQLCAQKDRPTALFCVNGNMGLGASAALTDLKLSVPQDISLMCGGGPSQNPYLHFPLDMIAQPITEAGRMLASMLIAQIRGEAPPGRYECFAPTGMIKAGSVGSV